MTKTRYILLTDDISELNQYMCGPLNRRDYLYVVSVGADMDQQHF